MRTLTLIRHAKSSWKDPSLSDRDRPLNKRGRRDAPEMGRRLAARSGAPDLLISSPAVRAWTTAVAIAEAVGYPVDAVQADERLYMASPSEILAVLRDLGGGLERIFLVAHNPGLTDLVNELSSPAVDNVPTCGVVELRVEAERWTDLGRESVRRELFDTPKKGRT